MRSLHSLRRIATGLTIGRRANYYYVSSFENVPSVEPAAAVTFHRLGANELPRLAALYPPIDADDLHLRLERGDRCYVGMSGDELLTAVWVQVAGLHPIYGERRLQPITPGEAWLYHARTADRARGLRLYPWLLTNTLRTLRDEGFSRAHGYARAANVASQRGIVRAGFVLTHAVSYMQIGPWKTMGRRHAPVVDRHPLAHAAHAARSGPSQ